MSASGGDVILLGADGDAVASMARSRSVDAAACASSVSSVEVLRSSSERSMSGRYMRPRSASSLTSRRMLVSWKAMPVSSASCSARGSV